MNKLRDAVYQRVMYYYSDLSISFTCNLIRGFMRLREAMIAAIRYDVLLAKNDRSDTIKINEKIQFISSLFRAKYQKQSEIRLSAKDCLDEDWYLIKDGKEFVPDSYYFV